MDLNIIVVSLERATDRVQLMREQLDKLNSKNIYYYPCFDGNYLTNETYSLKINVKNGYCYRKEEPLTPGDLGCNLSHIGALSVAKTLGMEYVIIMEDDILICEDFQERIEYLFRKIPDDWEHIYLSGIPHLAEISMSLSQKELLKTYLTIMPSVYTDCTFAYIVRNTAYDKLIKKITALETTTDDIINNFIFTDKGMKSYMYFPYTVCANSNLKSYAREGGVKSNHPSILFFNNKIFKNGNR